LGYFGAIFTSTMAFLKKTQKQQPNMILSGTDPCHFIHIKIEEKTGQQVGALSKLSSRELQSSHYG